MKLINIFGAPGSGKSTLAAGMFYHLKKQGINVELVTEQAKNFTWEERYKTLKCQPYVFAKQLRDIWRIKDKVDYAITDSPLLMSLAYTNEDWPKEYSDYVKAQHKQFDNINLLLLHKHIKELSADYRQEGRNQGFQESLEIQAKIQDILVDTDEIYGIIEESDRGNAKRIVGEILLGIEKGEVSW